MYQGKMLVHNTNTIGFVCAWGCCITADGFRASAKHTKSSKRTKYRRRVRRIEKQQWKKEIK